ncbi:hypothetical protein E8E95_27645 [Pseudomonas sp. BN414]|uniref:hypothetical protein n=1 Tax=Pseudomonas sp. BN414 TaxID=2567888 RepID=UPI0024589698|nr:hypothetical protein [Pseudomonas sp. BN414]MDH4570469.1 hypothetical protein [Pseudomonas sp. BN414]
MSDSVFDGIVRRMARKLAQQHIAHALEALHYGGLFNFEECKQEVSQSFWARKNKFAVFDQAYYGEWYWLGSDDALKGWRRFERVEGYHDGWRAQVLSLAYNGWVNARVIEQFGWIDEVVGQQYINCKRHLDKLDWVDAPHDKLSVGVQMG